MDLIDQVMTVNKYDVSYHRFSPLEKILLSIVGMSIGVILVFIGLEYWSSMWVGLLSPGAMIFTYSALVCMENMKYFGRVSESRRDKDE